MMRRAPPKSNDRGTRNSRGTMPQRLTTVNKAMCYDYWATETDYSKQGNVTLVGLPTTQYNVTFRSTIALQTYYYHIGTSGAGERLLPVRLLFRQGSYCLSRFQIRPSNSSGSSTPSDSPKWSSSFSKASAEANEAAISCWSWSFLMVISGRDARRRQPKSRPLALRSSSSSPSSPWSSISSTVAKMSMKATKDWQEWLLFKAWLPTSSCCELLELSWRVAQGVRVTLQSYSPCFLLGLLLRLLDKLFSEIGDGESSGLLLFKADLSLLKTPFAKPLPSCFSGSCRTISCVGFLMRSPIVGSWSWCNFLGTSSRKSFMYEYWLSLLMSLCSSFCLMVAVNDSLCQSTSRDGLKINKRPWNSESRLNCDFLCFCLMTPATPEGSFLTDSWKCVLYVRLNCNLLCFSWPHQGHFRTRYCFLLPSF